MFVLNQFSQQFQIQICFMPGSTLEESEGVFAVTSAQAEVLNFKMEHLRMRLFVLFVQRMGRLLDGWIYGESAWPVKS